MSEQVIRQPRPDVGNGTTQSEQRFA